MQATYRRLAQDPDGKTILLYYKSNKSLKKTHRDLLCRTVIKFEKEKAFENIVITGEPNQIDRFM